MDGWWVYLPVGALVGFMAGLLGVGGGMVLVPLLLLLFAAKGFPAAHLMHMALATAMATVPFTSASSVYAHHVRGGVDWLIVRRMLPGLALGAVLGTLVAGKIPDRPLAIFFAAFIFYAATSMFFDLRPKATRKLPGRLGLSAVGALVSFLASFLAAGGAFMTIPFMAWCSVPLRRAVGTAGAIGFPLALAASAGYALAGIQSGGLPLFSLGYIYLPALGMIAATSVLTAPFGARVSQRMPVHKLRIIFAVLLYAVAAKMLTQLW